MLEEQFCRQCDGVGWRCSVDVAERLISWVRQMDHPVSTIARMHQTRLVAMVCKIPRGRDDHLVEGRSLVHF